MKKDISKSYSEAGVNINNANEAVDRIKEKVKSTFGSGVVTGLGTFGAMFDMKEVIKNYKEPILVQSIDGVGTKLKIAVMMNKFDTVGMDIVNHCSDDILSQGARSLTFLDYIAAEKLSPQNIESIVTGMVEACKESGISLIGGEVAEMPGVYERGEHDIAGCILGVVDKKKIIDGKNIKSDDVVLGLASNGLHTNGYSLARKLFFDVSKYKVDSEIPELEKNIGDTLLEPHTNYTKPILNILDNNIKIKGIAHITGGGFIDNIPRILPENYGVEIKNGSWPILPVFKVMQNLGNIEEMEMYRTFNMGIGMIIIVSPSEVKKIRKIIDQHPEFKLYEIGKVISGAKEVKIV